MCVKECLYKNKIEQENSDGIPSQRGGCNKLDVFDWMKDVPQSAYPFNIVEVRFKNTRKQYYQNVNSLHLEADDIVAVEASPGHDIGVVSLSGELVREQLMKNGVHPYTTEFKKIYRKAKPNDIEKWKEAINLEKQTMLRAREIAIDLKLDMKIGDVEYQGDKTKAVFFYIAEDRVDFRDLIKLLATEFGVRIEMRQIGARQEAGRIGGIGSCGNEICCSTWMTSFVTVTTGAARKQELSLNPQKLAGQCGKLKCCLNYELKSYTMALSKFPETKITLMTKEGEAYLQKTDVFKEVMWYSFDKESAINLTPVPLARVKEIIALNKSGEVVERLVNISADVVVKLDYENVIGQDSLTRFENTRPRHKKKRKKKNRNFNVPILKTD